MSSPNSTLDQLRIDRTEPPPGRSSRSWLVITVVVLLLAAAAGVWQFFKPRHVPVRTLTVAAAPASGTGARPAILLNAAGYVVARREATVSSKVTGKVMIVLVEEGFSVKEGDVLAR